MKNNEILSKLEEMQALRSYSGLGEFSDPKMWKEMSLQERELLGTLFVLQSTQLATEGNPDCQKCLRLAAKAAPASPQVFYNIGEVYLGIGEELKILKAASRSFAKAARLNPEFFEAWAAYALTETKIGELNKDLAQVIESDTLYEKAYNLIIEKQASNAANWCWRWGGLWYRIAKISGEPSDYHQAIQKFTLAGDNGQEEPNFFNDFGNLLAEQATLIGSTDLFEKAIWEYEMCLSKNARHAPAYLNLGCASLRLFEATGDIAYFNKGEQAFRASSDIDPHQSSLWLFWGTLELAFAKRKTWGPGDRGERFLSAIKKFEVADLCEPDHPVILLKWSEALMFIGSIEENSQHLKEALEKIKRSIHKDPERPDSWYFFGRILLEHGRYFQDERMCFEAREKFQMGIKLDPQFAVFHYGIAEACMELAEITDEFAYLEESERHFKKMIESSSQLSPQFFLSYGIVLFRLGEARKNLAEMEAAVVHFEKALSFFDEKQATPLALDIMFNYAAAKSAIGDLTEDPQGLEKAARIFAEILHIDADFESIRVHYALSLQHLGEMVADIEILREAIHQYETAIQSDPEDDLAWNRLGITLISLSEMLVDPMHGEEVDDLRKKAELNLLHAISLGCDESFYNLACLFSLADNVPEALYFLEKARFRDALPPVEDIMNDEWLINIRSAEEFRAIISTFVEEDEEEL